MRTARPRPARVIHQARPVAGARLFRVPTRGSVEYEDLVGLLARMILREAERRLAAESDQPGTRPETRE